MKRVYPLLVLALFCGISSTPEARCGASWEQIALVEMSANGVTDYCYSHNTPFLMRNDEFGLVVISNDADLAGEGLENLVTLLMPFVKTLEYYLVSATAGERLAALTDTIDYVELPDGSFLLRLEPEQRAWVSLGAVEVVRLGSRFTYLSDRSPAASDWDLVRDPDPRIAGMVAEVSQPELYDWLVDLVGFTTRNSYTTGCQQATQYVHAAFTSYGLDVSYHPHTSSMAPNVIGELPGLTTPEQIYIICGHLDSTAGSPWGPESVAPGADDNGTGSVAVLAAAEILSQYRFNSTIRFICFTGEEQGLYGSEAYADMIGAYGDDVRGVINYDMIGWVEPAPEDLNVVCNNASSAFTDAFIAATSTYTTLPTFKQVDGSMSYSDHYHFWLNGYPAFCGIEDNWPVYPYYHTTQDTVDKVDFPFLTQCVQAGVAALATFATPIDEEILYLSHTIDDSIGDDDHRLDPGETVEIVVHLTSYRTVISQNVQALLSCMIGAEYVQIVDGTSSFGDIDPNAAADNAENPFIVTISPAAPQETQVTFMLTITASGGYQNILGFSETITSKIEVCPIYYEPMMVNPGWFISGGTWGFGQPTGQGGQYGESDPSSGYDGANVYGYNLNGDYSNNMPEYHLTSSSFDCSDYFDVHLKFKQWLGVERNSYDHAKVQVSTNGINWTVVWENGSSSLNGGAWESVDYDISTIADHEPTVYLRWTMGPTDSGWTYCGWNIDEVELCGSMYPDPSPSPTPGHDTPTPTPTPNATATQIPPTVTSTFTPNPSITATATPTGPPSSTPTSATRTPEPTHALTATPIPEIVLDITMNDAVYSGGDSLRVDVTISNSGPEQQADFYLALDVYQQYFFYPSWGQLLDYDQITIPGLEQTNLRILDLVLPTPLQPDGPFTFWTVLTYPATISILGNIDWCSFQFY